MPPRFGVFRHRAVRHANGQSALRRTVVRQRGACADPVSDGGSPSHHLRHGHPHGNRRDDGAVVVIGDSALPRRIPVLLHDSPAYFPDRRVAPDDSHQSHETGDVAETGGSRLGSRRDRVDPRSDPTGIRNQRQPQLDPDRRFADHPAIGVREAGPGAVGGRSVPQQTPSLERTCSVAAALHPGGLGDVGSDPGRT